ncbi:DUF2157 domain-containing protein [Paenibacillus turpanensis]|uniref:DUF2157 domain-containing protein n=1 Tax=Paenibacillus turpanensis TaxID=2689078 RepID=UPI00140DD821|nr:DUF2157 domain-containing protein [Paenibacillus turpanensis]
MSKKWLQQEGPQWVNEQIITREQYERILSLYCAPQRSIGLLPILGCLLLGLGVLSFVAANWQDLPELFRIGLMIAAMIGFYIGGQRLLDKGHASLGIGVIGIGLFTFGASIILIGQMFHMIAYSALSIVIWSAAGTALAYLYRSRYLYTISLILVTIAQFYSSTSFHSFNYAAFVLLLVGLGYYALRSRDTFTAVAWSATAVIQSLMLVTSNDWKFLWYLVPLLLIYTAGDFAKSAAQRAALQFPALGAAFIFAMAMSMFGSEEHLDIKESILVQPLALIPVLGALLVLSWLFKQRAGSSRSFPQWMLFLPLVYLPVPAISIVYLIIIFVFSLYVLVQGYAEENRRSVNIGTVLFLVSTMIAYFKLTWGFLDKSLFFITGGLLLLLLSWLLNRKRKHLFQHNQEG